MTKISPILLSRILGQQHAPTAQQAAIIGAEPGPLLVVAGAGAGKTETMAARVVWLVANGFVAPDQVLGLTFTRKAAQQLSQRIRHRLETLAGVPTLRDLDPGGTLARNLQAITPTVSTYDSYAGSLIREYGLLLPVEPSARLITQTELYHIARGVVDNYRGELTATQTPATVTEYLLRLASEMDNHMVGPEEITEESWPMINLFEELPKGKGQREGLNAEMRKWRETQITRLEYMPLVEALKKELHERAVITFGEQMSTAARLASRHPQVGYRQRRRFRVVMLDEYQDTSHSQRVLLRSLFGGTDPGLTVNAVGDPMQAIYGWRGATAANLDNFITDFPVVSLEGPRPAPKRELTTSWRNPPEVLDLANAVSREVLGPADAPGRTVQPLVAREGAPQGQVSIGWFATAVREREFIADEMERHWKRRGEGFTAAVLVRKRRHSAAMAQELSARGIPVEIVGLSGLLDVPEIADMVAIATMLVRPQHNAAALRILAGPHVGLGLADLLHLQDRARNIAGRVARNEVELPEDPVERLQAIIDETVPAESEEMVGLADAVSDLGEGERYSEEGYRRLKRLSAQLRHLRRSSLGRSLPDIFAEIETVFGIRTEVLAREDPRADGAAGTVHLDRFAEEVAAHGGAGLPELLDFFDLARNQEDGLEPGEVRVRSDRVQILTVHKAKGLEWDIVSVLHADASTYDASASTWLKNVTAIPGALRGDAEDGAPILDTSEVTDRKELQRAGEEYTEEVREGLREENTRLFYVGITRSERVLMVTASAVSDEGGSRKPYDRLEILRSTAPESVVEWWEGSEEEVERPVVEEALFPRTTVSADVVDGAAMVREAMEDPAPASTEGGLETLWEREVGALIEEQRVLSSPVLDVEISLELTATDLVSMKNNPEQFARRLRRPVPFKPNSFAKRGTRFHQWLEDRFGATALLDEDELPGIGEESGEHTFTELRRAFLESAWSRRTPAFVEHPFEVVIGGHVIRGRMDAVFEEADGGWLVVDWKTGRTPTGPEMAAAIIQLAVYRIAWANLQGVDPAQVRGAFHYVADDHTFEPERFPEAAELADLLSRTRTPMIN
ncbi:ATP-dependent helicase [Corynebacterium pacaense]|uniref:ATP-dependent helicase n=1 Tax=Corynebacterium pacaense TaxID=1816684 RepID=UPI0009BBC456|nr:UvrD-helicase domain-containing protein [Corynebacterium pacaense]